MLISRYRFEDNRKRKLKKTRITFTIDINIYRIILHPQLYLSYIGRRVIQKKSIDRAFHEER